VSPVIATLLLILIAVAAAVLLYTWVSGLSANVAGTQVTGKSLTLIQATWARPATNVGTTISKDSFDRSKAVLILSFQPPAQVLQGGQAITIDAIDVLYQGRVVCHYDSFPMTADDKYHIGQTIGGLTAFGLVFWGFVGSTLSDFDAHNETLVPGGIIHGKSDLATQPAARGYLGGDKGVTGEVHPGEKYKPDILLSFDDQYPFATILAGTWEVNYVSTNYVETNFRNTSAVIKFDRFVNTHYSPDTQNNNGVPIFDVASASQSNFAVVIWCPNVNPNVMQSVDVKMVFSDGSTWEASVPLSIT
nr:Chain A, Iho670 [Ignicoccus hospitalis]5KYH_B Chain B, Iho670 [Ignicoccus hospitalis]5KYH_C Chain C, Iho670 [Ignicoccus hospitalis]5KYH_D Chain D, Iho670 [Ignicoccus hospitalis]5KYH_E Chain E, Iho670 [Ignicoccus hospitalis]5KYH_F Chain F, Iho670 [Ignicoccus hospitalis]5KYH_G Chain G, Iho670 [Ignicoccus hospitalis]5KYH_H Chain H, Iho670 [Ignicoccus hospitalis]5KYH_I Chain I, Iho670 [Ignicoccus hospitalis]5KYH_J Chain J, Iho670 [Ignicoccus hospitalis]5KYH_K Chain K, Iho670 [Ignicoccus ho